MMLRRYHPTPPDDEPDDAENAPQADKPAGRSAARAKAKKE
ncbi:hypothetical protein [Streptomyces sp. NPDC021622]